VASRPNNSIFDPGNGSQPSGAGAPADVLSEEAFQRLIALERRRSERSQRPFVLLLIEPAHTLPSENNGNGQVLQDVLAALRGATRETDVTGWHKKHTVVGVMFTEIVPDNNQVLSTILSRIRAVLRDWFDPDQFGRIKFSFHVFPDHWDPENPDGPTNSALYPDLQKREQTNRFGRMTKRLTDIAGSLSLLVLVSPVVAIIAAAIKLTSRGPVLFRQKRNGEHGKPFMLLKFRTMNVDNDASKHKEYVCQLIAGDAAKHSTNGNGDGVFKLVDDPRITSVGRILRRTSLDELPQLINVLHGEMSLVGPRPPLPYEVEAYATWHRRRLLEAKPGITGLWQVNGRSRVGFDEMVRLDLRYARDCSPWLDLKILLQTPRAVIGGDGAC
jgi:lipopolysaccharide/colanic/teichoic acid biosynthesis glycosyltransferase